MTDIQVIHTAFEQAKRDVADAAGRLGSDKAAIDTRVSGFLGHGWTGVAAESFVEGWDTWQKACTDIEEGLAAMGQLLDAAHQDFIAQDEGSQRRLDQVAARIIDRLA